MGRSAAKSGGNTTTKQPKNNPQPATTRKLRSDTAREAREALEQPPKLSTKRKLRSDTAREALGLPPKKSPQISAKASKKKSAATSRGKTTAKQPKNGPKPSTKRKLPSDTARNELEQPPKKSPKTSANASPRRSPSKPPTKSPTGPLTSTVDFSDEKSTKENVAAIVAEEKAARKEDKGKAKLDFSPALELPVGPDTKPCEYLDLRLKQYRTDQTNLGRKPLEVAQYGRYLVAEDTFLAISSVMEALPSATRDTYSLMSIAQRTEAQFGPVPVDRRMLRPGGEMLIVVEPTQVEGTFHAHKNHIALAILRPEALQGESQRGEAGTKPVTVSNGPRLHLLDSLPRVFAKTRSDQCKDIKRILEDAGWEGQPGEPSRNRIRAGYINEDAARQSEEWVCGLHTIFNGWAYLLRLAINPGFRKAPAQCYMDAVEIVNMALGGFMDSATIHAFLSCYHFILPDQQIPEERRLRSTMAFPHADDMNVYVTKICLREWFRARYRNRDDADELLTSPTEIAQFIHNSGQVPLDPTMRQFTEVEDQYLAAKAKEDEKK